MDSIRVGNGEKAGTKKSCRMWPIAQKKIGPEKNEGEVSGNFAQCASHNAQFPTDQIHKTSQLSI